MVRKIVKAAAILLVLGIIIPQAVEAASVSYTNNSGSVPAVKGVNTGPSGAKGVEGVATATTGVNYGTMGSSKSNAGYGVYGQNISPSGTTIGTFGRTLSPNGRGVQGNALANSGVHYGVYGAAGGPGSPTNPTNSTSGVFGLALGATGQANGVFGRSNADLGNGLFGFAPGEFGWGAYGVGGEQGVHGEGGVTGLRGVGDLDGVSGVSNAGIGSGGFGVLSDSDLGVTGHLVGGGTNVAGECTVPAAAQVSATCLFQDPFDATIGKPIVVLTPTEDPDPAIDGGADWWVTLVTDGGTGDYTGFVVNMDIDGTGDGITFNFHVVGIDDDIASTRPARAVRRSQKHDKF